MLLSALLPAGTPTWLRLLLEVAVLLLLAQFLLRALRRGRVTPLALAAVAWMWFFWPPGHLWMLDACRTALAHARGLVPVLMDQAKAAASESGRVLGSTASQK